MRRFHRPSRPTVLALIALTVSLSGTGFAFGRSANNAQPQTVALTWHAITLKNGWVYADFGSYHAQYSKSGGIVRLRGSLSSGSPYPAVAFRLPIAARPRHTLWLPVYALSGSSGGLEIDPDGRVKVFDDSGSNTDVTGYTSLDGISFSVP